MRDSISDISPSGGREGARSLSYSISQAGVELTSHCWAPDHCSVKIISEWIFGRYDRILLPEIGYILRTYIYTPVSEILGNLSVQDSKRIESGIPQRICRIGSRHTSATVELRCEVEYPFP